jgi:hypothetical protein
MKTIINHLKESDTAAWILGGSLILAVIIGGIFYTTRRSAGSDTLTVTGSARLSVVADNAIWRTSVTRTVDAAGLSAGYADLAKDLKVVQAFLAKNGIEEKSVTVAPVSMFEEYRQNDMSPRRYTLSYRIDIDTTDVNKITEMAKNIDQIVAQGVLFQSNSLDYYYSGLNDVRVSLLTDAISDARARAEAMAKSSRQKVGPLKSATSGVVQVLSKGSVEVSDYGSYDTSRIDKDIMVTVRATFGIK